MQALLPCVGPAATPTRRGPRGLRRAGAAPLQRPLAVAAAAAGAGGAPKGPYTASNRYRVVDPAAVAAFQAEVELRRQNAVSQPGYVSHEVVAHPPPAGGPQEFTVTQVWDSKAAYEAWFNTPFRRRSHFPPGVWQHKPENKFSVPEEFCPFVQSDSKDE